jgi:hypothetical protein
VTSSTIEYFNQCLYGKGTGVSGVAQALKVRHVNDTLRRPKTLPEPVVIAETPLTKAKRLSRQLFQSRGIGELGFRSDKLRGLSILHEVLLATALVLRDEREDPRPVVQFDIVMSVLVAALGVARSTLYAQLNVLKTYKLIACCGVVQQVGETTRYTNTTLYVTLNDLHEPKLCRHEFKKCRRNLLLEIANSTTFSALKQQIEQLAFCEDKEELVKHLVCYAQEHSLETFLPRIVSCSIYDLRPTLSPRLIESWAKNLQRKLSDGSKHLNAYLKLGWKLKNAMRRGWDFLDNINSCLNDALLTRCPAAAFWYTLTHASYWEELWLRT